MQRISRREYHPSYDVIFLQNCSKIAGSLVDCGGCECQIRDLTRSVQSGRLSVCHPVAEWLHQTLQSLDHNLYLSSVELCGAVTIMMKPSDHLTHITIIGTRWVWQVMFLAVTRHHLVTPYYSSPLYSVSPPQDRVLCSSKQLQYPAVISQIRASGGKMLIQ